MGDRRGPGRSQGAEADGAPLPPGKVPEALLRDLLARMPPLPPEVELGPAPGEDACAIRIGGGTLVAAADPITLTGRDIGSHAVVINANDVAVAGVRPRWFLAVLLLPPGTRPGELRALVDSMADELRRLGVALVGGHTEVTAAVSQPVVVGQMLGFSERGRFVRTGGVRPGDRVLQVGRAPVEGAAVLAAEARARLAHLDPATLARALEAVREPGISVVEAALAAAELGAVALHDPTEGGLAQGLHELAAASGVALVVDADAVQWFEPGLAVCRALGADPWGTLASGCLLVAAAPTAASRLEAALRRRGHPVATIARAETGSGVRLAGGSPLPRFERDEVARILAG